MTDVDGVKTYQTDFGTLELASNGLAKYYLNYAAADVQALDADSTPLNDVLISLSVTLLTRTFTWSINIEGSNDKSVILTDLTLNENETPNGITIEFADAEEGENSADSTISLVDVVRAKR